MLWWSGPACALLALLPGCGAGGEPAAAAACPTTPLEDRLPSVVAAMAGREPIWLVDGSFGRWSTGDRLVKSVWVLSRRAPGRLVVTGRRLEDRVPMLFQNGTAGAATERLVIDDPAAAGVVPGGATPEILERYTFVMSYLIYAGPGCWEIDARLGDQERRIVVEVGTATRGRSH